MELSNFIVSCLIRKNQVQLLSAIYIHCCASATIHIGLEKGRPPVIGRMGNVNLQGTGRSLTRMLADESGPRVQGAASSGSAYYVDRAPQPLSSDLEINVTPDGCGSLFGFTFKQRIVFTWAYASEPDQKSAKGK
jgi:hypothetical protein